MWLSQTETGNPMYLVILPYQAREWTEDYSMPPRRFNEGSIALQRGFLHDILKYLYNARREARRYLSRHSIRSMDRLLNTRLILPRNHGECPLAPLMRTQSKRKRICGLSKRQNTRPCKKYENPRTAIATNLNTPLQQGDNPRSRIVGPVIDICD